MTRDDIDKLWYRAQHIAILNGEEFTRYTFAELVLQKAADDVIAELMVMTAKAEGSVQ